MPVGSTPYCPICVAPFRVFHTYPRWLTFAVLMTDLDDEFGSMTSLDSANLDALSPSASSETISCEIAAFDEGLVFRPIYEDFFVDFLDKKLVYGRPDNSLLNPGEQHPPYRIPVHFTCLQLTEKLWSMPDSQMRIKNRRQLWRALRVRTESARLDVNNFLLPKMPEYLVPSDATHYRDEGNNSHWTRASPNPAEVEEYTSSLMRGLSVVDVDRTTPSSALGFRTRYDAFPAELQIMITSRLAWSEELPLECTYLLPQAAWLKILTSIPFLWDIDLAQLQQKARERCAEGTEWNWELLVRRLMQKVGQVFRNDKPGWNFSTVLYQTFRDLPGELRSRRRMYQLLMDMYVGDGLDC